MRKKGQHLIHVIEMMRFHKFSFICLNKSLYFFFFFFLLHYMNLCPVLLFQEEYSVQIVVHYRKHAAVTNTLALCIIGRQAHGDNA